MDYGFSGDDGEQWPQIFSKAYPGTEETVFSNMLMNSLDWSPVSSHLPIFSSTIFLNVGPSGSHILSIPNSTSDLSGTYYI